MENVTLDKLNFKNLLPSWMQEEKDDASLADSVTLQIPTIAEKISALSKWNRVDEMTAEELDAMAYELNITWYRYSASVERKREIVKNARKVHRKLGTKWALEYILTIYFDDATVLEWFDYGGEEGHFKIQTYNTATVDEDAEEFLRILDTVKKYSQILDTIDVTESSSGVIDHVIIPQMTTTEKAMVK